MGRTSRELEINAAPAEQSEGPVLGPDRRLGIDEAEGVETLAF